MINSKLSLDVGSNIRFMGDIFTVDGYIVFEDNDGTSWIEYSIESKEEFQVLWLSVDKLNDEYAIYSEEIYSEEFLEKNIKANGYKEVDSKSVRVLDYGGNVDVDLGEEVFYKEYEDNTEELLISIEDWNGYIEYSKGYYIYKDDIEILDLGLNDINNTSMLNKWYMSKKENINVKGIVKAILIIIVLLICLMDELGLDLGSESYIGLSEFIKSNSNFQYETSITSDLDAGKKADVYLTSKSIEEATKLIIDGLQGNIADVQENEEDGAVVIMTSEEMALIYSSEDSNILVQVSSREYVYSSRNTLYRGNYRTNHYYRSYYYSRGYNEDQERYNSLKNGYSAYRDGNFLANDNNKYKTYSDSIRQSSVSSRSSSGDGISSGK